MVYYRKKEVKDIIRKNAKAPILLAILTASFLLLVLVPMGHACINTQTVSGTFFPTNPGPPSATIKSIGSDIQIWDVTAPMTWSGDIAGAGTYIGHWFYYKVGTPDFIGYSYGVWTLNAVVDGKSGTVKIEMTSMETNTWVKGSWEIIGGTGDLSHLQGGGTFYATSLFPNPPVYAYTGEVCFRR